MKATKTIPIFLHTGTHTMHWVGPSILLHVVINKWKSAFVFFSFHPDNRTGFFCHVTSNKQIFLCNDPSLERTPKTQAITELNGCARIPDCVQIVATFPAEWRGIHLSVQVTIVCILLEMTSTLNISSVV